MTFSLAHLSDIKPQGY